MNPESSPAESFSIRLKAEAIRLGFAACGIARAGFLDEEAPFLDQWIARGYHAGKEYISRNRDKRLDPRLMLDHARSVIVVLASYHTAVKQADPKAPVVSRYALGRDYHLVILEKLAELTAFIKREYPEAGCRSFVDSSSIMERAWAIRAGLGRAGKNAILINPDHGSFVFIGDIVTDLELEYDQPMTKDFCGKCTRCMDACPTGALKEPAVLDARLCIANHTTGSKTDISEEIFRKSGIRIYACDICQEVCPWNKPATIPSQTMFGINEKLVKMTKQDWLDLTETQYAELTRESVLAQLPYTKLREMLGMME
jgi:epoxyqueuosine reductase